MSALAWIFGLGALTIAFPFLFHLIRKTPKGRQEFSSLMFLQASPPKLTSRSRLENILLLLLRSAAILLLAFAFMRPFFRTSNPLVATIQPGRTVAVLLDDSASMRRGEVWKKAIAETKKQIKGLSPRDSVGLFTFGDRLRTVCDFPNVDLDSQSGSQSADRCVAKLDSIKPTWQRSRLGGALASLADTLTSKQDDEQDHLDCQIIVVSDFQKSSSLKLLQSLQWPENVKLKVVPVESKEANASLQILSSKQEQDEPNNVDQLRVRIRNFSQAADTNETNEDLFQLAFEGDPGVTPLQHYVPPEQSRIVRLDAASATKSTFLSLSGDPCEFDNRFYFVPPQPQTHQVVYFGDDSDPDGLRYYLERALIGSKMQTIEVVDNEKLGDNQPCVVFVADPLDDSERTQIQSYLDDGVLVVFVLDRLETVKSCRDWIGAESERDQPDTVSNKRRSKSDYFLLTDIDFQDSIFSKFNNPRFSDFTGIKFWERTQVRLNEEKCKVIARFDDESPAVWRPEVGDSRVVCFALGWQPNKSQFSRSTKFVPILNALVKEGIDQPAMIQNCFINQPIPVDSRWELATVIKPDGTRIDLDTQSPHTPLTDLPGIYTIESKSTKGKIVQQFAVNLDPAESETKLMAREDLEAFGVVTGEQATAEERQEMMMKMEDKRIESQQQIWKWAIVATIGLLIIETYWSGRRVNSQVPATI